MSKTTFDTATTKGAEMAALNAMFTELYEGTAAASQAEAEAGADQTKKMTPLRVAQALRGASLTVSNNAARDAIPAARRISGMEVKTMDSGKKWSLESNLTTWTEILASTGGHVTQLVDENETPLITTEPGSLRITDDAESIVIEPVARLGFRAALGISDYQKSTTYLGLAADRWHRIIDLPAATPFICGQLFLEFRKTDNTTTARGIVLIGNGGDNFGINLTQLAFQGPVTYTDSTHEHGVRVHRRTGDGTAADRFRVEVYLANSETKLVAQWNGGPANILLENAIITTDAARLTATTALYGAPAVNPDQIAPFVGPLNLDWRDSIWKHWALERHGHFAFLCLTPYQGIKTNQNVYLYGTSGERVGLTASGDVSSRHSRALFTHDELTPFVNGHTHDGRGSPTIGVFAQFQKQDTIEGGSFGTGTFDGGMNAPEWSNGANVNTHWAIDTRAVPTSPTAPAYTGTVDVYSTTNPGLSNGQIVRWRIPINLAGINAANFVATVTTAPTGVVSGVSPDPDSLNGKYKTSYLVRGLNPIHWIPAGKALTRSLSVEVYTLGPTINVGNQTSLATRPAEVGNSDVIVKAVWSTAHGLVPYEPLVLLLTGTFAGLIDGYYSCNVLQTLGLNAALIVVGPARMGMVGEGGGINGFTATASLGSSGWSFIRGSRDRVHSQVRSEVYDQMFLAANSGNSSIWPGAINKAGHGRNVVLEGHNSFGYGAEIITREGQVVVGKNLFRLGFNNDVIVGEKTSYLRFQSGGGLQVVRNGNGVDFSTLGSAQNVFYVKVGEYAPNATGSFLYPYASLQPIIDECITNETYTFTIVLLGSGCYFDPFVHSGPEPLDITIIGQDRSGNLAGITSTNAPLTLRDAGTHSFRVSSVDCSATNNSQNGNNVTLYGVVADTVQVSGYPGDGSQRNGSSSGNVFVFGACPIGVINANGGNGTPGDDSNPGGNGGNGGYVLVEGPSKISFISVSRGEAGTDNGAGGGSDGATGSILVTGAAHVVDATYPGGATTIKGAFFAGNFYVNTTI